MLPSFESPWETLAFWGSVITIAGVIVEGMELVEKASKKKWFWKPIGHRRNRLCVARALKFIRPNLFGTEISGFVLVALGLTFELYGGTKALLASDEENRQLKRQIAGIDPLKQPIFSLSAYAKLLVRPSAAVPDMDRLPTYVGLYDTEPPFKETNAAENGGATLLMGESLEFAEDVRSQHFAMISADNVTRSVVTVGKEKLLRFDLYFGENPDRLFSINNQFDLFGFNNGSLTPDEFDAIDLLLPIHCEVIDGEIDLQMNGGALNRIFKFPKQTTVVQAATSVMTNVNRPDFRPIPFDPKLIPK